MALLNHSMALPSGPPAKATSISSHRAWSSGCPNQNPLSNGCWVANTPGVKHDNYFTDEARYYCLQRCRRHQSQFLRRRRSLHLHQWRSGPRSRRRPPAVAWKSDGQRPNRGNASVTEVAASTQQEHHWGHRWLSRLFAYQHYPLPPTAKDGMISACAPSRWLVTGKVYEIGSSALTGTRPSRTTSSP